MCGLLQGEILTPTKILCTFVSGCESIMQWNKEFGGI
jgi:hypothetical protein